jgi:hypothetical protein
MFSKTTGPPQQPVKTQLRNCGDAGARCCSSSPFKSATQTPEARANVYTAIPGCQLWCRNAAGHSAQVILQPQQAPNRASMHSHRMEYIQARRHIPPAKAGSATIGEAQSRPAAAGQALANHGYRLHSQATPAQCAGSKPDATTCCTASHQISPDTIGVLACPAAQPTRGTPIHVLQNCHCIADHTQPDSPTDGGGMQSHNISGCCNIGRNVPEPRHAHSCNTKPCQCAAAHVSWQGRTRCHAQLHSAAATAGLARRVRTMQHQQHQRPSAHTLLSRTQSKPRQRPMLLLHRVSAWKTAATSGRGRRRQNLPRT